MTDDTTGRDWLYERDQRQVEAEHDHLTANPIPRSADDLKLIELINVWIPPRKLNDATQLQRE